jgi:two-component system response regulator NreC
MLLSTQPDIELVGEATTADEAVALARSLNPDIVILDLSMPGGGLPFLQNRLPELGPTRIIVLTMHEEIVYLRTALRAGCWAFVLKRSSDAELIRAIREVAEGRRFVDPSLVDELVLDLIPPPGDSARSTASPLLTARETEVLRLVALGLTNREVADRLCVSEKTVETHRLRICKKLGTRGRAALVSYALELGLLAT